MIEITRGDQKFFDQEHTTSHHLPQYVCPYYLPFPRCWRMLVANRYFSYPTCICRSHLDDLIQISPSCLAPDNQSLPATMWHRALITRPQGQATMWLQLCDDMFSRLYRTPGHITYRASIASCDKNLTKKLKLLKLADGLWRFSVDVYVFNSSKACSCDLNLWPPESNQVTNRG